MIGLIDYGAGNFASVRNAIQFLGLPAKEVRARRDFDTTTHLILPGVGSYGNALGHLKRLGLIEPLREHIITRGKPFLGICVGMQILSEHGYEDGQWQGLGLIPGAVRRLNVTADEALRLPHMGWNTVIVDRASPLFRDMPAEPSFYFAHSYHLECAEPADVSARCTYGGLVTAAVQRANICGVQFHPEKSQGAGLQLLRNFACIAAPC